MSDTPLRIVASIDKLDQLGIQSGSDDISIVSLGKDVRVVCRQSAGYSVISLIDRQA